MRLEVKIVFLLTVANAESSSSDGWMAELAYIPFSASKAPGWPWFNARIGLQYIYYNKFNGTTVGAHDNNTLFLHAWLTPERPSCRQRPGNVENRRQDPRQKGFFSIEDGFRGSGRLDGGRTRARTWDPLIKSHYEFHHTTTIFVKKVGGAAACVPRSGSLALDALGLSLTP